MVRCARWSPVRQHTRVARRWLPSVELIDTKHQLPNEKPGLLRAVDAAVHATQDRKQRISCRIVPLSLCGIVATTSAPEALCQHGRLAEALANRLCLRDATGELGPVLTSVVIVIGQHGQIRELEMRNIPRPADARKVSLVDAVDDLRKVLDKRHDHLVGEVRLVHYVPAEDALVRLVRGDQLAHVRVKLGPAGRALVHDRRPRVGHPAHVAVAPIRDPARLGVDVAEARVQDHNEHLEPGGVRRSAEILDVGHECFRIVVPGQPVQEDSHSVKAAGASVAELLLHKRGVVVEPYAHVVVRSKTASILRAQKIQHMPNFP